MSLSDFIVPSLFCVFASRPNLWIGYATTASIALFLPASVSMFFAHTSSLIRKIVGLFYGVVCVTIAFRAWNGFFAANEFVLMSRNLIQTLSFTTMFLLLIVGGSGFLLLFKEQADKLMSESEEKYRTLVEKANESICIIQDRKVVFANGTASELLGVSQDNLIGRPFTDFIFPDDMEIVMSYYVGRSEKREIPDSYNFRVMNQKGEPIWVLNSATLIEYGGKQAVIALITNINKLKLMEKERERMIEELKKALATVKTLSGLLPICASCKKIRDDKGYWNQIESYISDHSEAKFSHAICPECSEKLYPELYKKK